MEYKEIAAKRRKKRKTYVAKHIAFMRLLRLFVAIIFSHCVAYAAALSVTCFQSGNLFLITRQTTCDCLGLNREQEDSNERMSGRRPPDRGL